MASDAVKAESEKKLKELGGLVTKFIIRRTNDLLSKYCKSSIPSSSQTLTVNDLFQCQSNMNMSSFVASRSSSYRFIVSSSLHQKSKHCSEALIRNH